jgi:hypothetical protein
MCVRGPSLGACGSSIRVRLLEGLEQHTGHTVNPPGMVSVLEANGEFDISSNIYYHVRLQDRHVM